MKVYRPTSPGRRGMTAVDFSVLAKKKPEKRLTFGHKRSGGRNFQGRITSRFRGGGAKRMLRQVDFGQEKRGVPGAVRAIEYDPNRTAFIALVSFKDGDWRYILSPDGLKEGDPILIDEQAPIRAGSRMMLKHIPTGTPVHNIALAPEGRGKLVRSAGTAAVVLSHEGRYTQCTMPSREVRLFLAHVFASVGTVSNAEWISTTTGKAGRSRLKGRRPHVRGSAMNPVDHPHGGGEGRSPIGLKYPKTPWGKHALGVKTRKRHKHSNSLILQRRTKR